MAANFGKLFGRKKKTQNPKIKNQGSTQADDSDEDEGYQDPTENCPTEPPGVPRISMPTYPPPRPNSPKTGTKQPHQQQQPRRDDYQDPWDSKRPQHTDGIKKSQMDYEDPFDSKFGTAKQKSIEQEDEEYSEPYESHSATTSNGPHDTYEDPWDTRKNIDTSGHSLRTMSSSKSNAVSTNQPIGRRDDYSDPWDSKEASSFKSNNDEFDDTYSDPYDTDKQTILDGNRKSVADPAPEDDDDDDLYDMPEDEKNIVLGKSGNTTNLKAAFKAAQPPKPSPVPFSTQQQTASLQSQSDYDAPWEWKAKNVEEEFAKRFSVGETNKQQLMGRQPAPPPRKKSSPQILMKDLNINPVPKPVRNNFPIATDDGPRPYEVDPTIPLDNQGWFHGNIRRGDAEELLRAQPDCSYLIRNSESNKKDYSLSLRNHGETMHLKISNRDGKYILGMNSRPYETIPDMIHHYARNKLNIRGAEHVKLQYPVLQEAMYFTVEPGT